METHVVPLKRSPSSTPGVSAELVELSDIVRLGATVAGLSFQDQARRLDRLTLELEAFTKELPIRLQSYFQGLVRQLRMIVVTLDAWVPERGPGPTEATFGPSEEAVGPEHYDLL